MINLKNKIYILLFACFYQLTAYAEVKSCDDIQASTLKKILFSQIEKNAIDLNILFPTKYVLNNVTSSKKDDEYLRAMWEEFKDRSKLKILRDALEEQYENPKICTYHLRISLINSIPNGYKDLEIFPRFVVKKLTLSKYFLLEDVKIEKETWAKLNASKLDENNASDFLDNVFDNFRIFIMLKGGLNQDKNFLSKPTRQVINTFFGTLDMLTLNYGKYFEDNYFSFLGKYEDNTSKVSVNIISKKNNEIILTTNSCGSTKINAVNNDGVYENKIKDGDFKFEFDPGLLVVYESNHKCLKDGKYRALFTNH